MILKRRILLKRRKVDIIMNEDYIYSGKTVEDAITNACVSLGVTSDQITYEVTDKGSKGLFSLGTKEAEIQVTSVKGEKVGSPSRSERESAYEMEAKEDYGASSASVEEEDDPFKIHNDGFLSTARRERPERSRSERPSEPREKRHHEPTGPSDPAVCGIAEAFLKDLFSAMKLDVTIKTELNAEENLLSVELSGPEMGVIIGKRGQTLDSLQYITSLVVNRKTNPYTRVKIDTEDYRQRRQATLENLAKNVASRVKRTRQSVSLESMNPYERRIIHFALQNDRYVNTHSEGEEPYRHVVVTPKGRDDDEEYS